MSPAPAELRFSTLTERGGGVWRLRPFCVQKLKWAARRTMCSCWGLREDIILGDERARTLSVNPPSKWFNYLHVYAPTSIRQARSNDSSYVYCSQSAVVPRAHELVTSLDHRHPVLAVGCAHRVSRARPRGWRGTGSRGCSRGACSCSRREHVHVRTDTAILRCLTSLQHRREPFPGPEPRVGGESSIIGKGGGRRDIGWMGS